MLHSHHVLNDDEHSEHSEGCAAYSLIDDNVSPSVLSTQRRRHSLKITYDAPAHLTISADDDDDELRSVLDSYKPPSTPFRLPSTHTGS